jgi:hypothetical protein
MNTSSKSDSIGLNSANPATGTRSSTNSNPAGQRQAAQPAGQRGSGAQPQSRPEHTPAQQDATSDIADCITDNIETPEPSNVVA